MKKRVTLLLAAGLISSAIYAQNGFYLSPSAGMGISSIKDDIHYTGANGQEISRSSIFSYNARLGIGYKLNRWRLQTGIQYWNTGFMLEDLVFGSDFDPGNPNISGTGSYKVSYSHLGIPLQVGYTFLPNSRFNLTPYLGMLTSYNLGAKSVANESGNKTSNKWPGTTFSDKHNRISIWGSAALYGEYKLNERLGIFAGPSAQYMLSNFSKAPGGKVSSQRNYAFNVDLGVKIGL